MGSYPSKGWVWLASGFNWAGTLSQAGGALTHEAAGFWWAAMPEDKRPVNAEWWETGVLPVWDEQFGDRRQELVFIGIDMDAAALSARLDECLLTDQELAFGPEHWKCFEDPFPVWRLGSLEDQSANAQDTTEEAS
ncbi:hypothetical protein CKX93_00500 [Ectothiorhodosinus mongolicus]|nr:hypothetical protein CKX93_00500 [Ectothiorhodosinus mongolicus]